MFNLEICYIKIIENLQFVSFKSQYKQGTNCYFEYLRYVKYYFLIQYYLKTRDVLHSKHKL